MRRLLIAFALLASCGPASRSRAAPEPPPIECAIVPWSCSCAFLD